MANVKKISDLTMEKMKKKSILTKPSNLSARGVTEVQVKAALTASMFDRENSLASEVNRVVDEINEECISKDEVGETITEIVEEKTEEIDGRLDELEKNKGSIHYGKTEGENKEGVVWFELLD